jgi:ArsR family transcriptional regulator, arsenate/arsenite/antimonite-responsive transcriptional repressor
MNQVDINNTELSSHEVRLVNAMQALGDKTRFKMFKILQSSRKMCVSEIARELNVSTPAISQHFRIFELVGLVDKQRQGHKICYVLKNEDQLIQRLSKIMNKE